MKIAIIGAGNMGGATARGIAQGSYVPAANICISNPSTSKLEAIKRDFPDIHITQDNQECVSGADLIILAVKPWKIEEVILQIKDSLDYNRIAIASVAGGMGTDVISNFLKRDDGAPLPPVFYIIPNTAIAVRQSMTFISSARASVELQQQVLNIFKELGDAMLVEERQMGAGMALASCGIAYAMRYVRAATEGGVELGMYAHDAQRIVQQTLAGAVALLEQNGSHPEQEIDRVTTPGGFTIRGLNAMEEAGFTNSVIQGLRASIKK